MEIKGRKVMGDFRPIPPPFFLKLYLLFGDYGGKMVLVENVREIIKNNENITPRDLAEKLNINLEVAIDILDELRRT